MVHTEDLTIVCLKWGDWDGEYVNNLYEGVRRNCTVPYKFLCITDDANNISPYIDIWLTDFPDVPGNLKKMVLYDPELGLKGRVVCFDLDTVIVGNIDEIVSFNGWFAVLEDFYHPGKCGGGIIAFNAPDEKLTELLYDPLFGVERKLVFKATDGAERIWFRQRLGAQAAFWQKLYPDQIVSYKPSWNVRLSRRPPHARIICFHGSPRPHEVHDWTREYWDEFYQ